MFLQEEFMPYKEQISFIDFILGDSFPWYWSPTIEDGKSDIPYYFSHTLVTRDGSVNSDHWKECLDLFDTFCTRHQIEYKEILRASLNCSIPQKRKSPGIHQDHFGEHSIFILYLNDSDGDLRLYENKDLAVTIQPKKMRAIMFDGHDHDFDYPSIGQRRIALVIRFIRVKPPLILAETSRENVLR
jgi:hypothetical protein